MPIVFRTTPTGIQQGPYSQLIVTPITNLTATSTVAGQIVLTWSGGAGYNVQYSYAVSTGTIQSTSGTNPTTITLTSTSQITTNVTLTETVLGGSTSAVSNSVTTINPNGTAHFAGYDSSIVNGSYTIFSYTTSKTTSNAITFTTNSVPIYVFVVAGGGSGGGYSGGGGGAGGLLQRAITSTVSDNVSITVGAQSVNAATSNLSGSTGNDSIFTFTNQPSFSITAKGGGGGGTYNGGYPSGTNGGSGGGCTTSTGLPGTGIAGQGNNGGTCVNQQYASGGGGAGAVGGNATASTAGNGGTGVQINTTTLPPFAGTTYATYWWAGGGGGAAYPSGSGQGGAGGGASAGSSGTLNGTAENSALCINAPVNENGGTNTGGGGGGDQQPNNWGGKGGSGIVLVGIPTSYVV